MSRDSTCHTTAIHSRTKRQAGTETDGQPGQAGERCRYEDRRDAPVYVSIDRLTNEIVDVPTNKVRIPNRIGLTELSKAEQEILGAGLALPKEVTLKGGRKFEAMLQVNADKRDVEFVPEYLWQGQSQRRGNGQEKNRKARKSRMLPDSNRRKTGIRRTDSGATARGRTRTEAYVR